jgi:hypothetical protein
MWNVNNSTKKEIIPNEFEFNKTCSEANLYIFVAVLGLRPWQAHACAAKENHFTVPE